MSYDDTPFHGTCSECGCDLTAQEGGMCSVCYARVTEPES
jgi:NMD protein affecting ribosome stability and mRNA decay